MHRRKYFENGIFENKIIKNPLKIWRYWPGNSYQSLLMFPHIFRNPCFEFHHLIIWCLNSESFFFQKITIGKLCKPFHHVIIISYSTFSWNHKRLEKKDENFKNLKNQKILLSEIKIKFITFLDNFLVWLTYQNYIKIYFGDWHFKIFIRAA